MRGLRDEPSGQTLSYDRLVKEVAELPGWHLHASGLSMTRDMIFAVPGSALLFVTAAGCLARRHRRWPIIAFERERVWVTLRDLEHGLGRRDLELACQLERLVERCEARAAPARSLGRDTQADLDALAARVVAAARGLVAKLRETRPAEESETPGPGAHAPVTPQSTGPTDPSESS